MRWNVRDRIFMILLGSISMAALIVNMTKGLQEELSVPVREKVQTMETAKSIRAETELFHYAKTADEFVKQKDVAGSSRNLQEYYALRAYPGAPPRIPHPITADPARGGYGCLQCHANGGFVEKFQAFAPITPHPDYLNCQQCHVAMQTEELFQETSWQSVQPAKLGQAAMPGSPPRIPHSLQLRENCLACHAGAAAVPEIRTTHPERINCRQCHVPMQVETLFAEETK